jgi:hypothetical protein
VFLTRGGDERKVKSCGVEGRNGKLLGRMERMFI